ncbi:hypothetical protein ACFOEK_03220 [Litoribrevibacter euphylliae]|uniref:DUF2442 domain-containing protein n=1 Tax=Litoribrevibacter euphylliae TaxID=1834034 RepID=A0ABV7HFA6_9GAMM
MTRKTLRKVHIDGEEYVWVANCDDLFLYPFKDMNIRVFRGKETKSILYIDANAWHFELTPKHIKDAISYALSAGWQPSKANTSICLSKNENGYFVTSSGQD